MWVGGNNNSPTHIFIRLIRCTTILFNTELNE